MRRIASSLLVCLSLAFTGPAFAHHGFNAEFDASKSMRWMGIVTKVEWTNPHARFYIDVKDSNGSVTNWNFEMGSVLQLRRQGWTRDSLKVGDQVTVEGYPAKDGAKMASAKKVTLADGRSVFGGLATEGSPAEYKQQ
jgi:V8-like Glu-specific endopeptidase